LLRREEPRSVLAMTGIRGIDEKRTPSLCVHYDQQIQQSSLYRRHQRFIQMSQ
jgi:hypothetical protein